MEFCILQHVLYTSTESGTYVFRGFFPVCQSFVLQSAVQERPLYLQALVATRSHYVITYVLRVCVIFSITILNTVLKGKEWLFYFFLPSNYSTD